MYCIYIDYPIYRHLCFIKKVLYVESTELHKCTRATTDHVLPNKDFEPFVGCFLKSETCDDTSVCLYFRSKAHKVTHFKFCQNQLLLDQLTFGDEINISIENPGDFTGSPYSDLSGNATVSSILKLTHSDRNVRWAKFYIGQMWQTVSFFPLPRPAKSGSNSWVLLTRWPSSHIGPQACNTSHSLRV